MAVLLGMWMVVELDVVPTEEETGRLPVVWLFTGSATLGTRAGEERDDGAKEGEGTVPCLLYTSPSPRDRQKSRMPSSA